MVDTKRSLSSLQTLLANNTAGDITPQHVRDFLLSAMLLDSLEVSITTTATATLGAMHVCSGTSADYTVTLPTAVGNAGKFMSFRMSNALSKLVTLDANGAETINDSLTRIMHDGESATLISDGVQWLKTGGVSIPMEAVATGNTATAMVSGTVTVVNLTHTIRESFVGMVDLANERITVFRPGMYALNCLVAYEHLSLGLDGFRSYAMIFVNSVSAFASNPPMITVVPTSATGSFTSAHCALSATRKLAVNDYLCLAGLQDAGQILNTRIADTVRPFLSICEIPSW